MFKQIKSFLNSMLDQDAPGTGASSSADTTVAIVSLLCEVSNADHDISESEEHAIVTTLSKFLMVDSEKAQELLAIGKETIKSSNSVFDFTSDLSHLDQNQRINLITAMWEVAYADNHLDPMEEAIIRKVAALIYVDHNQFIRTKLAVLNS
ncbi:MAG: TerB family tellurite resistance protein [Psychromonas sp.]